MAWFDILGGALEGAQQGVANAQQLFLTQRELADRQRRAAEEQRRFTLAEQRASAEEARRTEEFAAGKQSRAVAEVAALLQTEDPLNLDPQKIKALSAQGPEYARAVQQLVQRQGETYALRMDPLAAQKRRLDTAAGIEAQAEAEAKAEIRQPDFKTRPYEEQLATMQRAGLDPSAQYRLLSPENKQLFRRSGGAGLETDIQQERFNKEFGLRLQDLGLRRKELDALTRYRERAGRVDEDTANRNYYLGLAKLMAEAKDDRARQVGAMAGAYMRSNPGMTPEQYQQAFFVFAQMAGMMGGSAPPPPPAAGQGSAGRAVSSGVFSATPGSD